MVTAADILNARVLVVDDKEANVLLIEGILRVAGYVCVQSTTNPKEVCDLHRANRYDLILLDLQMPGRDGFEVMEELKTVEDDGYLPVLVITAQPSHKLRALEAGAKDFIGKPFDMAELKARVHNLLEVRLLHRESKNHERALEETVRELEISRDIIRLKTLEETEKREQEFALAQETQESLLPRARPQFENFKVHACSTPTRFVGGDFYDFMNVGAEEMNGSAGETNGHIGSTNGKTREWIGVLADVSGKGMPAALLSSMVLGALSMEFRSRNQPQEALDRVNRLLYEKSLPFQFVTLFLFLLSSDGAGRFISAGHNPAYLYRAATGEIEKLVPDGFALGMFDFASYKSRAFHLDLGDLLVIYSDGLTDAENPQQEMYGDERLLELIGRQAPSGGHAVEQNLLSAINDFTQGLPQTDDITFMVVEKSH